ncbi:MAG: PorT family protein [Sphingobacteriales bacterium]|nr:PorT family protein [Sphingobacteriales bacterium]
MPANDFEKRAEQLLDDVKIRPSDRVWVEVEKRIREKKRRRWILIIPLLAGLVAGGIFIVEKSLNGKQESQVAAIGKKANENSVLKDNKNNDVVTETDQPKDENKTINHHKETSVSEMEHKINAVIKEQGDKSESIQRNKKNVQQNLLKQKSITNKVIIARINSEEKNKAIIHQEKQLINGKNAVVAKESKSNKVDIKIISENNPDENSVTNHYTADTNKLTEQSNPSGISTGESKKEKVNQVVDSAAKIENPVVKELDRQKKRDAKKKWQFGILISGGISNAKNNVFDIASTSLDKALAPLVGSNPGPVVNNYPSRNYAAFAMQAGVFIQKNISRKSDISTGLNYALYQSRITTGQEYNSVPANLTQFSSVRAANSVSGNNQNYYSKLHYLEVPVNFSTQINRGKKLPLHWSAGASIGFLMGSNYLHFDTLNHGVYFKDNSLLTKTNISLQSGFSFTFFQQTKSPVSAGPLVQFGLMDFIKGDRDKRYWLYGGLRLQMLLSQKKKK